MVKWLMLMAWTRIVMNYFVTKHKFLETYPYPSSQEKPFLEFEDEFPADETEVSV